MNPIIVMDATFNQQVLTSPTLVVVEFWSPAYGLWPGWVNFLSSLRNDPLYGGVKFCFMDINLNPITRNLYNIQTFPSLLLIKNPLGAPTPIIDKIVGAVPQTQIQNRMNQMLP